MRVHVTWEFETQDVDKLMAKEMKYQEIIKKDPDKYPKNVVQVHIVDRNKAVTIWDVENQEQIANKIIYMMPEARATIVPIIEASDFMKFYMQSKK